MEFINRFSFFVVDSLLGMTLTFMHLERLSEWDRMSHECDSLSGINNRKFVNIKITKGKIRSGTENLSPSEIRSLKTSSEFFHRENEETTNRNFKKKKKTFFIKHVPTSAVKTKLKVLREGKMNLLVFCVFNSQNYFINEIIGVFVEE